VRKVVAVFLFLLVLIGALIFNSASSSASGSEIEKDPQRIKVKAADGLGLNGWLIPNSADSGAPLIVMLPMMGHDHTSYDQFIEAFMKRVADDSTQAILMPHLLSLDLRGHGKSTECDTGEVDYDQMRAGDFAHIPSDVDLMIKAVLAKEELKIDSGEICLIGASIGANGAVLTTEIVKNVAKLVLLSPGDDYRGLKPMEALKGFTGKTLIFASVDDTYSAQSANNMSLAKPSRCKLELFAGQDHGTNIIAENPEAMSEMIEWLLR